jgi:hypothetical protein
VEQRTVARLIVKNSLNTRLKELLVTLYSTGDNNCYPNTVSDALSLLSTFIRSGKDTSTEDAIVSYHAMDAEDDITNIDVPHEDDVDTINTTNSANNNVVINIETGLNNSPTVRSEANVMAAIISEATAEEDRDQFFGASFEQLQEVDDAYEKDEPDVVCSAHVIENDSDIVCGAHITDDKPSNKDTPASNKHQGYPNPHPDFEMILYHTAQRVNNKRDVFTVNYDSNIPGLISYHYKSPCAESVIDYSDAIIGHT